MEINKINKFFKKIIYKNKLNVSVIIVSHILPDKIIFFNNLEKICNIKAIIPKQTSKDQKSLKIMKKRYLVLDHIKKDDLKNKKNTISMLKKIIGNEKFIILDVGGYFSFLINSISETFKNQFLGVIEDTENGHIKYENVKNLNCPVFSVARSPLKYSEDILVENSAVYSAESVLR